MKTLGYYSSILLLPILLPVIYCAAQVVQPERGAIRKQRIEKERPLEPSAQQKIDETISRLSTLAGDAQTFKPAVRSHIQAQAANLLWKFDNVFARDVFLKAWASAELADREAAEKQQGSDVKSSSIGYPRDARREVISAAWQKDPVLGEELLAKLVKHDEPVQPENENGSSSSSVQAQKLSAADLERLNVATQLLDNDSTQAVRFAGDVLNRAVIPSLRFLSQLRERNPSTADEFYVSLLARVVADPAADANTVSLLSSYIFSPDIYVTITSNGSPRIVQNRGETRSVNVSPATRSTFLNAAAQILLRPTSDPAAQRTSYLIAIRLLPFFERFTPNLATQIQSRINELSATVTSDLKIPELVNKVRSGVNDPNPSETVRDILERAKRLTNVTMRHQLYIRAAILAAEQGDRTAVQTLQEIEDVELRDRVRPYIYMLLARHALVKKDLETTLEFARSDAISSMGRVWLYTQAVDLTRTKAAIDLLMQALAIARRMDSTDPNKARALIAVALQLRRHNRRLADPYLIEAVIAANKADSFDAEDATLEMKLETPMGDWSTSYEAKNFCLKNLFRELAKDNFFQALNIAEDLEREEVKSVAMLGIAEVVLTSVAAR